MRKIGKNEYDGLIDDLAQKIIAKHGVKEIRIYGVPKNGSIIAESLSSKFTVVEYPDEADIIVDDLIDSGKTKRKYDSYMIPFYTLIEKQDKKEWINFWFEKDSDEDAEELVTRQLQMIGEDTTRDGLQDTPKRVVKMWKEIFRGYDKKQLPKVTTFMNGSDGLVVDEMTTDDGSFYSQCEHHMVPFFGHYYFSYIPHPKGKVLGLSKVARVVDYFSAKLQIQERLVGEIVKYLWNELTIEIPHDIGDRPGIKEKIEPIGIGLVMVGEHLCKSMRGVKKKGKMRSTKLLGVMKEDASSKAEFLQWVNSNGK